LGDDGNFDRLRYRYHGHIFFTKEKVEQQQSRIKMYQAAFQASEREKAEAGERFLKVAAKLKPDVASLQGQQLLESAEFFAKELAQVKIPVDRTQTPTPSPQSTGPPDNTFYDLFKRNRPSPSPAELLP
jgi:hypothetical protein